MGRILLMCWRLAGVLIALATAYILLQPSPQLHAVPLDAVPLDAVPLVTDEFLERHKQEKRPQPAGSVLCTWLSVLGAKLKTSDANT